jgi:hypothetical protein
MLTIFLIFAFVPATRSQEYTCDELYEEWYDCLNSCELEDKRVIYWDLIAGGCYLPPVY